MWEQGKRGVLCDWREATILWGAQVFPPLGGWLLRRALRDWPVEFKGRPSVKPGLIEVSFVVRARTRSHTAGGTGGSKGDCGSPFQQTQRALQGDSGTVAAKINRAMATPAGANPIGMAISGVLRLEGVVDAGHQIRL